MKKLLILAALLASSPAFAHVGDHGQFDLAALIAHIFETDHIVFASLAIILGWLAYRAGASADARPVAKEVDHDPR